MANISGWMIYPVDDITRVYCTKGAKVIILSFPNKYYKSIM